jgi:pimeloyl-ACP methyl ester carboxylesterase
MLKRIFKRVLFSLIVLSTLTIIIVPITYQRWRVTTASALESGSQLAETSRGTVEYARVGNAQNHGNALLILHGTPGGYDAGVILVDWLDPDNDTLCIIPSRPGYLRTPLDVGITPSAAADAMVALLDELGIETTMVLGWSGGGPTAIELAQRHPERVSGLILLSARIRLDDKYHFTEPGEHRQPFNPQSVNNSDSYWGPDLRVYLQIAGFSLMPDFFLARFFPAEVQSMELTIDRLRQTSATTQPRSRRELGRRNDHWQFASLERDPVVQIEAPTLIIHSPIDASVNFEHALYISNAIRNSELFIVENESHFSTLNADAARKIRSFLHDAE